MDYENFNRLLADTVKNHRKKTGLSQQELAKYAGVGKTVVYDLEHAKQTIQLNTLLKILAVLNIQLELSSPLLPPLREEQHHA